MSTSELATKSAGLRASLDALGRSLRRAQLELDAVVITGDLADQGAETAFALFPELLAGLPVSESRVLIVPGNHDVVPWLPAGDPDRWQRFQVLRRNKYLTPWLVGVDVDAQGVRIPGSPIIEPPTIVAKDGSFVIVGMNSADHSATLEPLDDKTQAALNRLLSSMDPDVHTLATHIGKHQRIDLARVDPGQMLLASKELGPPAVETLRLIALHHSVRPTGVNEEVKPYETPTNLGAVRSWIADNRVDVVLHGHKHVARVMHDTEDTGSSHAHDFLEISAPPIEITTQDTGPVGWLINTSGPDPRSRGLRIAPVMWQVSGDYHIEDLNWSQVWLDRDVENGLFQGETIDDVHRKIMSVDQRLLTVHRPIVCRVQDGSSCLKIPSSYPQDGHRVRDQEWFSKAASQWQSDDPAGTRLFNHGERLRGDPDQIDNVVRALGRPSTTKAVAVLLRPEDTTDPEKDFPSFSVVQFLLTEGRLDVIGFYRKQEMPHWWPVNVAELAIMQQEVIGRMSSTQEAGSITTIATVPAVGTAVPRVLVPTIDTIDLPGMFEVVVPLAFETSSASDPIARRWSDLFEDWMPSDGSAPDGDPVPVRGVSILRLAISVLKPWLPEDHSLFAIDQRLATLEMLNEHYTEVDRERWAGLARAAISELLAIVAESAGNGTKKFDR